MKNEKINRKSHLRQAHNEPRSVRRGIDGVPARERPVNHRHVYTKQTDLSILACIYKLDSIVHVQVARVCRLGIVCAMHGKLRVPVLFIIQPSFC